MESAQTIAPRFPRLRLSAFWYFYLAALGIFFPYYSLYLSRELRLTGTQVGLVLAAIPLMGLVTQPLWGQLADRTGSRRGVLAGVTAGTALAWGSLVLPRGFAAALLGTAALAVFSTAVLPMAAAVTMAGIRDRGPGGFGWVRMWGTLGFLTLVVVFPWLLGRPEIAAATDGTPWQGLALMFPSAALLCLTAALIASRLPRGGSLALRSSPGEARRLLGHEPVARLVLVVFAAYAFIMGPIHLFPLYVTARGGDVATIGRMWIFMLLLEAPLIGMSRHTLRWLSPRGLLTAGLVSEGVRWTTCALSTNLGLIHAVQLLHGVGVAGILVGAPLYIEQAVPERLRSTGQALVSIAGPGAGAFLSNVAGGWLFEHVGAGAPYATGGVGALALGGALYRLLPEPRRPEPREPEPRNPESKSPDEPR